MTAEFTNTIIFAPSNNISNSYSSSVPAAADTEAFSSALDNASKSYADKTENKSVIDSAGSNELAQKTKDIDSSKKQESKEPSKNSVNDKNNDALDKVSKNNSQQTETGKEIDRNSDFSDRKISEETPDSVKDTADCPQENVSQLQQVGDNKGLETQLVAAALIESDAVRLDVSESVAAVDESVMDVTVKKNEKQNVIANEQLLANIEYPDTADIEASLKAQIPDIDEKTLKAIVEEAKKAVSSDTVQSTGMQNQESIQTADISALKKDTAETLKNSDTGVSAKTVKDNLQSDMSRLTANIDTDESVQDSDVQMSKVLTPSDTEFDKDPVIKVTQEAAASANIRETAGLENKDTVSKIKDRAVAQMTALQDTDTVVTQSTVADSAEQDSLSQNNAQEQVVKLSVDESKVSLNSTGAADSFASRLESQISTRVSASNTQVLNQNDIMSQVNAKFEQLQQTGNNKVSIVLQPENLGRVSVEIMSTKEGVVAKMLTDNQQVKDLFDKNIDALKNNLSAQGVNVNNIKVECTQESSNNAMNFERDQFNQTFNNQQNSSQHGQTNQSETSAQTAYAQDSGEYEDVEADASGSVEIKNTDAIIKHNGKVDYTV